MKYEPQEFDPQTIEVLQSDLRSFFLDLSIPNFSSKEPNSVHTDPGVRITIDIDDAGNVALISFRSVTWDFRCQYINSNMPYALYIAPG